MILRKGTVPETEAVSGYPGPYDMGRGKMFYRAVTDAGGLTRFGAAVERLVPGGQSSQLHWHEREEEFLLMLSGEVTVIEGDETGTTTTRIGPGDCCCWKAGDPIGHTLRNEGTEDAVYIILGTRHPEDICHYPGADLLATPGGYTHLDGTLWAAATKT